MNILEELWYGNFYPNEQALKQNSEYAQALHKVVDEKESLLPNLARYSMYEATDRELLSLCWICMF